MALDARTEAEFDPLSGGLFASSPTQQPAAAPSPSPPVAAAAAAPSAAPSAAPAQLKSADLSKVKIVKDKKKNIPTKKSRKNQKKSSSRPGKNALFGGGGGDDDEDELFSSLRPKIQQGNLDAFLNDSNDKKKSDTTPGLFDDEEEDVDDDSKDILGNSSKGKCAAKGTGAYMKRMLEEEDDEFILESISDLKVAAMISTEADTAGGLIEGGSAEQAVAKISALADTTDESLLAVREDDDLDQLMAATIQVQATPSGKVDDDGMDLFKVDAGTNDEEDDDLFSMMGMGGDDATVSGAGGGSDEMSSIDAYIQNQSGGGGLFD